MKKGLRNICIGGGIAIIALFCSCKNFLDGNDILEQLNKEIEYANLPYANVSISALNSITDSISPSVGTYKESYKKGDKIDLKFEPKDNFQFVKWIVTPEESVSFENTLENNTAATILNSENPIVIEPLVYERNTVTFEPNNAVVQPKNIPIVINFTEPVEVTKEDLQKITITIDDLSIREYYQDEPLVSEDKKTIKIIPRRDKLLDVVSDIKIIKVTVPESFYHLKDDYKITLGHDVVYTFKINSNTETQATINFNCSASEGELSYSNTKTYNLDEEITSTFTPTEKYIVRDWNVKYSDGSFVEDTILDVKISDEKQTITLKVLTGTEKEIFVSPVCVLRDFLTVNFNSDYGITVPSEAKQYYLGQKITVNYRENPDYQFTGWKVYDSETKLPLENVIKIDSPDSFDTECTVLKTGISVILKAECALRPKVFAMTPSFSEAGVPWNSKIRIIFNQEISENSIYFSKAELNELGIPEGDEYRLSAGSKDKDENDLYYAYVKNGKKVYKNIQIRKRGTNTSLLEYFGKPALDSIDKSVLIIPTSVTGNFDNIKYKEIEVYIDQKLCDVNGVSLKEPFSNFYYTNMDENTDIHPPTFTGVNIIDIKDYQGKLLIDYKGKITDEDSTKIKFFTASLIPSDYTTGYSYQKTYSEKLDLLSKNTNKIDCSTEHLEFDFGNKADIAVGKYKLVLTAEDNSGNVGTEETEVYFENKTIRQPTKDDLIYNKDKIYSYIKVTDINFYLSDYLNTDSFSYNNCEYYVGVCNWKSGKEVKPTGYTWVDTQSSYTFVNSYISLFAANASNGATTHSIVLHIRPKNYTNESDEVTLEIPDALTVVKPPKVTKDSSYIFTISGRGTCVVINIDATEYPVQKIVTDIRNGVQNSPCIITMAESFRKIVPGSVGSNVFVFEQNIEKNTSFSLSLMFRGLSSTEPIVGTIYAVDTMGVESEVLTINYRPNN